MTQRRQLKILSCQRFERIKRTAEMKKPTKAQLKAYASAFASQGGKERAKRLTPERRSEIAKNAGLARWAKASLVPTV